jgi:hypothetical protein
MRQLFLLAVSGFVALLLALRSALAQARPYECA